MTERDFSRVKFYGNLFRVMEDIVTGYKLCQSCFDEEGEDYGALVKCEHVRNEYLDDCGKVYKVYKCVYCGKEYFEK